MTAPLVRRTGYWCSLVAVGFSAAYILAMLGVLASGSGIPPVAPYDTAISLISLLAAPVMVLLWTVVHRALPPERRVLSQASLAFVTVFAALTGINRYVSLTVVPQARRAGMTDGLEWFTPYAWPSVMTAIEMLAWGWWLGLAMLTLAPAFREGRLERALRGALLATGALCLVGVLSQVTGVEAFAAVGVLGWGPGMMAVFVLLALWFRRAPAAPARPAEALTRPAARGARR